MRADGMTSTLHDHHVRRLASVSVRQSPPHPILEHVASTARHYACVDRAVAWGWARERVVVMDEDQGHSGQRLVTRVGVPRVVATALAANVATIRVLEKAGLTFEKRYWYKGTLEAVKYALDRDVYLGRRA